MLLHFGFYVWFIWGCLVGVMCFGLNCGVDWMVVCGVVCVCRLR